MRALKPVQPPVRAAPALLGRAMLLLLGGCNTTRGIGQDIKSVGQSIERAAN
jgi:predicted small secreted protein